MWSKAKQKFVRSLANKKYREKENAFLAEGPKVVEELLGHFACRFVAGTDKFWASAVVPPHIERFTLTQSELEQASLLRSPQEVLAVFDLPQPADAIAVSPDRLVLALDGVQDPGNVGTILRIADWFGIEDVCCSLDTADVFSPKVVQATMGALARVRVHYVELPAFLREQSAAVPIYGTFLDGENLYNAALSEGGIVVMGNEGNGISSAVAQAVTQHLRIPSYPEGRPTSESLNVATATAVFCAEFRRRLVMR